MKQTSRTPLLRAIAPLIALVTSLLLLGCAEAHADESAGEEAAPAVELKPGTAPLPPKRPRANEVEPPTEKKAEYPVPPPPFSDGIFPCMDCHADMEINRERRQLEDEHDQIVLQHGPRERWCFDCHNPDNRDTLRLASGELVSFGQSYLLCGQCHGPKLRDWRVGVHGKRSGQWDGERRYLLCAHCHNPHAPRFAPVAPMPPPPRPENIR